MTIIPWILANWRIVLAGLVAAAIGLAVATYYRAEARADAAEAEVARLAVELDTQRALAASARAGMEAASRRAESQAEIAAELNTRLQRIAAASGECLDATLPPDLLDALGRPAGGL